MTLGWPGAEYAGATCVTADPTAVIGAHAAACYKMDTRGGGGQRRRHSACFRPGPSQTDAYCLQPCVQVRAHSERPHIQQLFT
jgi:hypothetical protein